VTRDNEPAASHYAYKVGKAGCIMR